MKAHCNSNLYYFKRKRNFVFRFLLSQKEVGVEGATPLEV